MIYLLDSFDNGRFFGATPTTGRHGLGATGTLTAENLTSGFGSRCVVGLYFKGGITIRPLDPFSNFGLGTFSTRSDGSLVYTVLDDASTSYVTEPDLWHPDVWHYLEVDWILKPLLGEPYFLSGHVHAYLDDPYHVHPIIYVGGVQTIHWPYTDPPVLTVPPEFPKRWWSGIQVSSPGAFDDLYVSSGLEPDPFGHDIPGSPALEQLGALHIFVAHPNGVGAAADWVPTPAVPNWQNVDETTPDEATTINSADAETGVGTEDLHTIEPVSTGDRVLAQEIVVRARKSDPGSASIAARIRYDGVTDTIGTAEAAQNTFTTHGFGALFAMPNGDPLTDANISAQHIGYRRED